MKLNLGSGNRNIDDFINIDAVKQTDNTVVGDILNLEYKNNSIEEIHSEHVVEHFDKNELDKFFYECSRLLITGGRLNIIAPSIVSAIDSYINGVNDIDWLDRFLFANHTHQYDYHKQSIYKEKLFILCKKYDFRVDSCEYEDRNFSTFEIKLKATKI